jgi:O-glycosyl hydrolase
MPKGVNEMGFTFVANLWGDRQKDDFKKLVKKGYAEYAMGMNEPNEKGQSNMDPRHGADLWKEYLQPLKALGYYLLTPPTSSNPNGYDWVKEFVKYCEGCYFDAVATHWYDVKAEDFIAYQKKWHDGFGKDIWCTEFACQNFRGGKQCTYDETVKFMATVTEWMDNTEWMVAYFAFGAMKDMQGVNKANQLMDSSGKPTALGKQYIS